LLRPARNEVQTEDDILQFAALLNGRAFLLGWLLWRDIEFTGILGWFHDRTTTVEKRPIIFNNGEASRPQDLEFFDTCFSTIGNPPLKCRRNGLLFAKGHFSPPSRLDAGPVEGP